MSRIDPVDEKTLDARTRSLLEDLERKWGQSWNIVRVMANAPSALEAMSHLWRCLERSSLSPADREVVALEMAVHNGCHYCVPAHRHVAPGRGLSADVIDDLVARRPPKESRAATIQSLTRRLLATKGKLGDVEFRAFQAQGITPQQMIEVVAEIAHCTMTNYMNRLADTDLDDFLLPYSN